MMDKLKNLADVPKEEQKKFLNSFDDVFLDIDGVVWHYYVPIEGAAECTNNLRKLGKRVKYVSNNGYNLPEKIAEILKNLNHNVTPTDVINPIVSILSYFKSIDFKDEIFMLGPSALRQELVKAGFKVAPEGPINIENNVHGVIECYEENPKIKAIVIDSDLSTNYIKLQKCIWHLRQPDCQLVVGMVDKIVPIGTKGPILGMYHFMKTLKDVCGKEAIGLAKPSRYFVELIKSKFNITEPNKVLMIGDSIEQDMITAVRGGFQKLLVLSGTATVEDINNWKYDEECKPVYYVEDLGVFNRIIESVFVKF